MNYLRYLKTRGLRLCGFFVGLYFNNEVIYRTLKKYNFVVYLNKDEFRSPKNINSTGISTAR